MDKIIRLLKRIKNKIKNRLSLKPNFSYTRIQPTISTINECVEIIKKQKNGCYLRFGDGDINLSEGKGELLHNANKKLTKEMKEALSLNEKNILKCLPIHSEKFGHEPKMSPGIHLSPNDWSKNLLNKTYQYFIGSKIYSPVALAYLAVYNKSEAIKFIKFLKKQKPIFVGNKNISKNILCSLFGENTIHIKTPDKSAYSEIDRIENELSNTIKTRGKYTVVIVAMGCAGRILEKRIINKKFNVFLFDFGSLLDALCEYNTRAWIKFSKCDKEYWREFIKKIKE